MQVYFIVSEQFGLKKSKQIGELSLYYMQVQRFQAIKVVFKQFVGRIPLHNFPDMLITFSFNVVLYLTCNKVYGAFLVVQTVKNLPAMQETRVLSLGLEDSLKKGMATPVVLPRELHRQRNLTDYIAHGVTESDTTE